MSNQQAGQYQHFVPQFLLRNFSHPYKPDGEIPAPKKRKGGGGGGGGGGGKPKYQKGMYPGDPVIRHLDLTADPPAICEKPVKRMLGQINMYDDSSKPDKQQREVEQMLSKLEDQASQIFRKIIKAHEQKEPGIWITRPERDLIRKFLFILKYRGSGFYERFNHDSPGAYSADDRELMREYMSQHGFTRPLDVWLHAIKTIINLDMTEREKWHKELANQMYTGDALWFVGHCEFYYMAICTPSDPGDEFILTDGCYNVFEGNNCFVRDSKTGEVGGGSHTPLHMFAPISPKLMIVLRANQLPNALEDADEVVKKFRQLQRGLVLGPLSVDDWGFSKLADLPIDKARNSYSRVVNGRLHLINSSGEWKPGKQDKFCFNLFPIGTKHVNMINGFLLDNCATCTSVVFESTSAFKKTLEWFLAAPCEVIGKIIMGLMADEREVALKKMIQVARSLGFEGKAVWRREAEPLMDDYEGYRLSHAERSRTLWGLFRGDKEALEKFKETLRSEAGKRDDDDDFTVLPRRFKSKTQFPLLYSLLAGTPETLFKDLHQAERMWVLRVKIDAWSNGQVGEAIRQRNRELLIQAYMQLPPRRVLFFVMFSRLMILSQTLGIKPELVNEELMDGPEHAIVRAHEVVKRDMLSTLIYKTAMNDIKKRRRPDLDIWKGLGGHSSDEDLAWSREIIFGIESGAIRDCGIPEIEQAAIEIEMDFRQRAGFARQLGLPPMFMELMTELSVRALVKEQFARLLGRKLQDSAVLAELEKALFEVTYPIPPPGWRLI